MTVSFFVSSLGNKTVSALSIEEALASAKDDAGVLENANVEAKREVRVLQVFDGLGMGGAETWLMSLLKYFREHNSDLPVSVKFDVLLTGGEKAIFDDEAMALGANLFYVRYGRSNLLSFVREFRKILAKGNYDAIHDHQDYVAGLHFLLGAGLLPPTRIAHVHNPLLHIANYATKPLRKLATKVGKRLLRYFATDIMGTSVQVLGEYGFQSGHDRSANIGAAHCGFDVSRYRGDYEVTHRELCKEFGWDNSSKIVLFVGRLEGTEGLHAGQLMTHKNPEFSLDVIRECIARDSTVRLLMAGSGEKKKRELEEKIDASGLSGEIRILGVRTDVPRLMLGSDLLLFPSLAEGLGMVVVEAQAAGLRVIASDTTPQECVVISDLVEFFSLSASAHQWASKVINLINLASPERAECNRIVRESPFSIENSAAQLCQLYAGIS
jgi:glycosyltransferase involved in cell wall biosynthesis